MIKKEGDTGTAKYLCNKIIVAIRNFKQINIFKHNAAMKEAITIKRTSSNNKDFQWLIKQLDHELWNELNEDQAQYDQYNKVPDLNTVVVAYLNDQPTASGCFKKYNTETIEIKRMFVVKEHRGKGLSKTVLNELENWAVGLGFKNAILETSIHFTPAVTLYKNTGIKLFKTTINILGWRKVFVCKSPCPVKEHFNLMLQ